MSSMDAAASQLERDHVHSVYERIAPFFNDSRYKAWPRVKQFLLDQEPGSIVADVGEDNILCFLTSKDEHSRFSMFICPCFNLLIPYASREVVFFLSLLKY